jgi:hypothetical protein
LDVQVDVDGQTAVRLDDPEDLAVEQQGVRAEVDVTLALDDAADQLGQLGVHRRLAAADRHARRAAIVHGLQADVQRQAILELASVTFRGAAEAGQVAGVQRLEHQDEGVSPVAPHRVLDLVGDVLDRDVERESHRLDLLEGAC